MKNNIVIQAHNVCYSAGGRTILSDVNLEVSRGEIVTLIGPNGAGKTTLVRILAGFMRPASGRVEKTSNLRIGYVPQKIHIDDVLPMRVQHFLQIHGSNLSDFEQGVLEEIGIERLLSQPVQLISGGEMQRVLLARAMLRQPDLLILDEPAQGVDVAGQQLLYSIIARLRDVHTCGVFMVSHDLHLVMAATDSVLCLNAHICCTGHPDDVSRHSEYLKLFGDSLDGLALYRHNHDHKHDLHGDVVSSDEHHHG